MTDTQIRAGTPADRKPSIANTAAVGLSGGAVVATVHYLIKSYTASHMVIPDDALIEMWVFGALPSIHLIGRIINHHLQKLAGDEQ